MTHIKIKLKFQLMKFTLDQEAFERLCGDENPSEYPPFIFPDRVQLQLRHNAEKIYGNKLQLIVDFFEGISREAGSELAAAVLKLKEAMKDYGLPVVQICGETAHEISGVYRKDLPRECLEHIGEPLQHYDVLAAAWNVMMLSGFCSEMLCDMELQIGARRRSMKLFERQMEQLQKHISDLVGQNGASQGHLESLRKRRGFCAENMKKTEEELERAKTLCAVLAPLDLKKMLAEKDPAVPVMQIFAAFNRQACGVLREHDLLPDASGGSSPSWIDSVDFDFQLVAEEWPEAEEAREPPQRDLHLASVIQLNERIG